MSESHAPTSLDKGTALQILSRMKLIRRFEEKVQSLFRNAELPGFVHVSIGQESVPAAACAALQQTDYITSTHRGHGHCIGKGVDVGAMMAELYGKSTGTNNGRGGSMHIADTQVGILGANGIVGANLGIAAGAALGSHIAGERRVAVAFTGDGAVSTGLFHEVLNLAAVWKLPLIVILENNGWTEMSRSKDLSPVASVSDRALSYGIDAVRISDDVDAIYHAVEKARADALAGKGPIFIDCATTRWFGHYEGDTQAYCTREEIEALRAQDSIAKFALRCQQAGYVTDEGIEQMDRGIDDTLSAAIEAARAAPEPVYDEQAEYNRTYAS
jgi:TPP-dependent pyruvate/acetoin dehydrogenase alpha subunit